MATYMTLIGSCDGCKKSIMFPKPRYHCLDCSNIDFCDSCIWQANELHPQGHLLRPLFNEYPSHEGVICSSAESCLSGAFNPRGDLFRCTICRNCALCAECFHAGAQHDRGHTMFLFTEPALDLEERMEQVQYFPSNSAVKHDSPEARARIAQTALYIQHRHKNLERQYEDFSLKAKEYLCEPEDHHVAESLTFSMERIAETDPREDVRRLFGIGLRDFYSSDRVHKNSNRAHTVFKLMETTRKISFNDEMAQMLAAGTVIGMCGSWGIEVPADVVKRCFGTINGDVLQALYPNGITEEQAQVLFPVERTETLENDLSSNPDIEEPEMNSNMHAASTELRGGEGFTEPGSPPRKRQRVNGDEDLEKRPNTRPQREKSPPQAAIQVNSDLQPTTSNQSTPEPERMTVQRTDEPDISAIATRLRRRDRIMIPLRDPKTRKIVRNIVGIVNTASAVAGLAALCVIQ